MKTIELTIVGFTNLNRFFDSLDDSKIEHLDYYVESIDYEDQEGSVYVVQYILND